RGALRNAQDNQGMTPLMHAALARKLETFRLLLENDADLAKRTPTGGTILMYAAQGGRVEIAELILRHGEDVNAANEHGTTALMRAAMHSHDKMVALLKEAGAQTGFLEAVALGDLERARSLSTPDTETRSPEWGQRLLHWAAKEGHLEAIQLL